MIKDKKYFYTNNCCNKGAFIIFIIKKFSDLSKLIRAGIDLCFESILHELSQRLLL